MADPSDSDYAIHLDGTLKDASEIEWHYDKDDDLPLAPVGLHPFFASWPALVVMVAGSHHSACTLRPSACIVDPDNTMNKGSSLTLASLPAVKQKRHLLLSYHVMSLEIFVLILQMILPPKLTMMSLPLIQPTMTLMQKGWKTQQIMSLMHCKPWLIQIMRYVNSLEEYVGSITHNTD
jgi:hypothetical protein